MRLLLLATAGGAIGSGARHLINVCFGKSLNAGFAWPTLFVNILGSLLMGLLIEMIGRRFDGSSELRTFFATGVLGGFTTFSAFSADAVSLIQRGDNAAAAFYVCGSVLLSILGLYVGLSLARSVFA